MALDTAALARASGALRGYAGAGQPKDQAEAHAALSDLLLTAMSDGNKAAEQLLRQARALSAYGQAGANQADYLLGDLPAAYSAR